MIYASFGGLLKDFRIRKNISQREIAFSLGWSEPSRLSRIEQGKTKKPKRKTVDKLMRVLKLEPSEQGQLLLAGGYLPTKHEIEKIRKETKPLLDNWVYPAYLLDFSWRLLEWNRPAARAYEIVGKNAKYVRENSPCTLELVFDPSFIQNKYLKDKKEKELWNKVLLGKLIRFKLLHKARTSEKWYQDLLSKMMHNKLFVSLWKKAQFMPEKQDIANYERKLLVDSKNTKKRFDFHIFRSPLLQDIRFEINYHIPGNIETFRYFARNGVT
jgi:transcriptional regulator with XRE-family HTH domain